MELETVNCFKHIFDSALITHQQKQETIDMSNALLPGIPDQIVEEIIWKKLKNVFENAARLGNFTGSMVNDFISLCSVSQKWRYLVRCTYLMGILKMTISDFDNYQVHEGPKLPKQYIPMELIAPTSFSFYSKYPKLKVLGVLSSECRRKVLKNYDSRHPLEKWTFTLDFYDLGYLEENPMEDVSRF